VEQVTVTCAGNYTVIYNLSGSMSSANLHLQSAIRLSGSEVAPGIDHIESSKANDHLDLGSNAILTVAAGGTIEVSFRTTDSGTPDIGVDHLNITIHRVG